MMGLGSFGPSSSSTASSNLSPLAPPFVVDRFIPKSNSNPLGLFSEAPYPPPFNTPMYNSLHSQNPDSSIDLIDSISSSSSAYKYSGPEALNPPNNTPLPQLNPSVEAKQYYSPYQSPQFHNESPLIPLGGCGYDLLSNSSAVPLNEPSRSDYTQSLTDLEYSDPWDGFWDGKESKQMELERRFCLSEKNIADPLVFNNYLTQVGRPTIEGLNTCEVASALSIRKFPDIPCRDGYKSSLNTNPRYTTAESSRPLIPTRFPEIPPPGLITGPTWNLQNQYSRGGSHDSLPKPSPSLIIRPPPIGTSMSAFKTFSSKDETSRNKTVLDKADTVISTKSSSEDSDYYNPAVDSPCWKGAPASRSSPFEISDADVSLTDDVYPHGPTNSKTNSLDKELSLARFDAAESLTFLKPVKPPSDESFQKMEILLVIDEMNEESKRLLSHCSKDSSLLNEGVSEIIESTIKNLSACIGKKGEQMTPIQDTVFPLQSNSHSLRELPDLHKGGDRTEHQNETSYFSASGKKEEKSVDTVFARIDADMVKDDKMIQAIKDVLREHFPGDDEETHPQSLFYKNLWLEAEAALCSINSRARFDRMKIEMEKFNQKTKDVSGNTTDKAGVQMSSASLDLKMVDKSGTEPKDSPKVKDTHISSAPTTNYEEDLDSSVMARFRILRDRVDNPKGEERPKVSAELPIVVGGAWGPMNYSFSVYDISKNKKEEEVYNSVPEGSRIVSQVPTAGSHDGSSSDWEHVLKDELTWQN